MAIYTGVADANGDFNIPFSANYTSGQKITVTAEKDSATKSIELYAPSDVTGGGVIQFTGNLINFPNNIGGVRIGQITGTINQHAFDAAGHMNILWRKATSLTIGDGVTSVSDYAFRSWAGVVELNLPANLATIGQYAFAQMTACTSARIPEGVTSVGSYAFLGWNSCTELIIPNSLTSIAARAFDGFQILKAFTIPATVTNIAAYAFNGLTSAEVITVLAVTPPSILATSFSGLNAGCIFKVPAASVAAYQAAPNWSAFAARIQAI
ncbi:MULTISPECIES: leucine-rich repeat domain-containing protein [unclassified Acinetobacter]|uniref:leucine-rich repeat domain-containing protein n=1 Tax=unclassified Acinetobacter TaxID=196816 RepID=UPI0015D1DE3F|nr:MULTISPECIES: leucine-rich repeat domain-containing protein [unclassified Acinetobacter]